MSSIDIAVGALQSGKVVTVAPANSVGPLLGTACVCCNSPTADPIDLEDGFRIPYCEKCETHVRKYNQQNRLAYIVWSILATLLLTALLRFLLPYAPTWIWFLLCPLLGAVTALGIELNAQRTPKGCISKGPAVFASYGRDVEIKNPRVLEKVLKSATQTLTTSIKPAPPAVSFQGRALITFCAILSVGIGIVLSIFNSANVFIDNQTDNTVYVIIDGRTRITVPAQGREKVTVPSGSRSFEVSSPSRPTERFSEFVDPTGHGGVLVPYRVGCYAIYRAVYTRSGSAGSGPSGLIQRYNNQRWISPTTSFMFESNPGGVLAGRTVSQTERTSFDRIDCTPRTE